jgi:hypothetical protein
VKKLIVLVALAVVAGCHSARKPSEAPSPVLNGAQTGAANPEAAVQGFMAAVQKQDLQAMAAIWGSADGPARELGDRGDLEKRELIMMCYLKHDGFDIIGDAPNPSGGRTAAVSVTYKDLTRSTNFQLVQGPGARWYVLSVDVQKLSDICARKG